MDKQNENEKHHENQKRRKHIGNNRRNIETKNDDEMHNTKWKKLWKENHKGNKTQITNNINKIMQNRCRISTRENTK